VPSIILRAFQRFSARINAVVIDRSVEGAREVYKDAALLPSLSTTLRLSESGYQLDGPLFEGSELTYCFRGIDVLVMKNLDTKEAARAHALLDAVDAPDAAPVSKHVVHFELKEEGRNCFMLMPKLDATLEQVTHLSEEDSLVLWEHVSDGLRWLHARGFSHADVKPANVGLRDRVFQLIDLGSVCMFDQPTSCTDAYVPCGFFGGRPPRGSAALDWWMLGMTLAEKCCRPGECITVGERSSSLPQAELRKHLKDHLPTALWVAFQAEIGQD
jgi:serine/threonine protein kinase